jgi:hypothetical protein
LGPYARQLLFTLKILLQITPLIGPALGAIGKQLSTSVQSRLELSIGLLQELTGHHIVSIDTELDKSPPTGTQINALYQQLSKITYGFAGLYPREIPEYKDSVFYLCADHRKQLEQPMHDAS